MKVIGIDPGLTATGYGIIDDTGKVLASGVISPRGSSLPERLLSLHSALCRVLECHTPNFAATEEVVYHRNPRSTLLLGAARGVTLLALEQQGIPVREFSPTKIKFALTGSGRASKPQVAYMVKALLHLENHLPFHVTDALACALMALRSLEEERKCSAL